MNKTVLIVEDEFLIALDLQMMMEGHGWRVLGPAASVRDALGFLNDELPSLGLLDVNLGAELVTPVAEALKLRGVPFIIASAHDKPEQYGGDVLAGAPNAGKPTSERRLLGAIGLLSQRFSTL